MSNTTAWYVMGLGLDEPLARVSADGTVRFYHQDALGSVIALTDSSGTVTTRYNYSPFGETEVTGTDPVGLAQPFRFTGREWDAETGMYYYRARYYAPEMGRFISEDPIRFASGEVNWYAYVGNNPVNNVDPLGLFLESVDAHANYCSGSGMSWMVDFNSINWGATSSVAEKTVKYLAAMYGNICFDQSIPVVANINAQTHGESAAYIGRHVVRLTGIMQFKCDCLWTFAGALSSAAGSELYDFDSSNRGLIGEASTWVGRNSCPETGKPFRIYIDGSQAISSSGKTKGKESCICENNK